MNFTLFFPSKARKRSGFTKPGVDYNCYFFHKDGLFHKKISNIAYGILLDVVTLYCGKWRKISKSCYNLDLCQTMPNVKIVGAIYHNTNNQVLKSCNSILEHA